MRLSLVLSALLLGSILNPLASWSADATERKANQDSRNWIKYYVFKYGGPTNISLWNSLNGQPSMVGLLYEIGDYTLIKASSLRNWEWPVPSGHRAIIYIDPTDFTNFGAYYSTGLSHSVSGPMPELPMDAILSPTFYIESKFGEGTFLASYLRERDGNDAIKLFDDSSFEPDPDLRLAIRDFFNMKEKLKSNAFTNLLSSKDRGATLYGTKKERLLNAQNLMLRLYSAYRLELGQSMLTEDPIALAVLHADLVLKSNPLVYNYYRQKIGELAQAARHSYASHDPSFLVEFENQKSKLISLFKSKDTFLSLIETIVGVEPSLALNFYNLRKQTKNAKDCVGDLAIDTNLPNGTVVQ